MAPPRRRLDAELVRRGLAESRTAAQEAIRTGLVTVDGAPVAKAASQVHAGQAVVVASPPRMFVSRGGHKLAHALERFGVDPTGRRALDAGVSTGGFTDCLRQRGATSVVAYDVGYGQVHDTLRRDPAVDVRERVNVRDLRPDDVPSPTPDLLVADLSFIALRTVLAGLRTLVAPAADAVLLVKPQFEAAREEVGKGGVVRDPDVWARVLGEVASTARDVGWIGFDATASPLLGPAGNVEFLVHLVVAPPTPDTVVEERIAAAVAEGREQRKKGAS